VAPFAIDYSAGNVLEWCVVDGAGRGTQNGAVHAIRGAPAVINTTISNSAGSGLLIENTKANR